MKKLLAILMFAFCLTAQAEINVRVSPLGLLTGYLGAEVDIPVSSAWTLGPELKFLSTSDGDYDVTGYSLGIRGNYWFNGSVFTQGWYFGPLLQMIGVKVEDDSGTTNLKGDATGVGATGFFGYQWMWQTFNINLGAGPALYTVNKVTVKDSNGNRETYSGYSGLGLALEFTLGWKF